MKKIALFLLLLNSFLYAKKIVVLEPSVVEMMYMLEAEDQILAIATPSTSKIWPYDKTPNLTSVGTYSKPNLEKIIELNPDYVVTSFHSQGVNADLEKFKVKTLTFKADSIDEIYQNISKIGEITDKAQRANEIIDEIKKAIDEFGNSELKGKKVAILFSTTPMMAFTKNSLPGDIFNKLGIINIADNMTGQTPIISSEILLTKNPDFIVIISGMGGSSKDDFLSQNPSISKTNAAKNNKIITIPSALLLRGTPRIKESIGEIYKLLK